MTHHAGQSGLRALAIVAGIASLIAGCATNRINWEVRVGAYTFDEAVTELGPPDKQAELTDKSIIAEWLLRHGRAYHYPTSGYYYYPGAYYGPVYPMYSESYSPDYYLRLTFGPDGKLKAWKNFSRY